MLLKFDKSTQTMGRQEEKYWAHFLKGDPLIGDFIESQLRHDPNYRKFVLNQPICPKCEGFCMWDKEEIICLKCGSRSPKQGSHSVRQHVRGGHYK